MLLILKKYFIFIFCIINFAHAQSVLTWQQVNTDEHELPWSTQRLDDGNVLMAAIRHATFTSKHKLLLLKISSDGNPIKQKEISLSDTSINTTGGIYKLNNTQFVVFATFSLDSPFYKPKYWGYLIIDTAFNYIKSKLIYAPFPVGNDTSINKFVIDFIRVKQNANTNDYYGTLVLKTPSEPHDVIDDPTYYQRYNTYFVFNNNLDMLLCRVDTVYQDGIYNINIQKGGCGDMLLLDDSNYITLNYFGQGFIYTKLNASSFALNNRIFFYIVPDTINLSGAILYENPYFLLTKHTDNSFILSGTISQDISDPNKDTTDAGIGQSAIAIIDSSGKLNKFSLLTPSKYIRTSAFTTSDYQLYNPPIIKNLDYLDKNKMYYTSTCADGGFWCPYSGFSTHVIVIKIDSNLSKVWLRFLGDTSNYDLVQYAYNVLATNDGGCMVFCRIRSRFFNDPFLNKYPVPEWNIIVYKINESGIVTSTKEINFDETPNSINVYPNPTTESITIKGLTDITIFRLFDVLGKVIIEKEASQTNATIDLDNISSGLYFYSLSNQKQVLKSGKIIVNK